MPYTGHSLTSDQVWRVFILLLMSGLHSLMTIAALDLAADMVPGPSALFVASAAATSRRQTAFAAPVGVVIGSAFWAIAALAGLVTVLKTAPALFRVLQVAGGIYLIVLGLRSLSTGWHKPVQSTDDPAPVDRQAIRQGVLVSISNPQVILFFGTLFANSFPADAPVLVRALAVPTLVMTEFLWYGSMAYLVSYPSVRRTFDQYRTPLITAVGVFLIAFGSKSIWTSMMVRR